MPTCIIADDMSTMRLNAKVYVQKLGFEVLALCEDGFQAFDAIHHQKPDVAFLDYSMPHRNGAEVARLVKEYGLPTKIIMITANGQGSVLKDLPIAGVLIKPFNLALMREIVLQAGILI